MSSGTITSSPATHDVIDVVGRHDLIETLDDLLRMVQMDVFDVPLKARLRPAASFAAFGLRVLHVHRVDHPPGAEHEDSRGIGIDQQRRIPRMFLVQPRERIEIRAVADDQLISLNGTCT